MKATALGPSQILPELGLALHHGIPVEVTPEQAQELAARQLPGLVIDADAETPEPPVAALHDALPLSHEEE